MTVFWLNLPARVDRRVWFERSNVQRWPEHNWVRVEAAPGGQRGCWSSHYGVWARIATGFKIALVMEDDARLLRPLPDRWSRGFTRLSDTNEGVPNWGTWAYTLTPKWAGQLLVDLPPGLGPVDHALQAHPHLPQHFCHPALAEHCLIGQCDAAAP